MAGADLGTSAQWDFELQLQMSMATSTRMLRRRSSANRTFAMKSNRTPRGSHDRGLTLGCDWPAIPIRKLPSIFRQIFQRASALRPSFILPSPFRAFAVPTGSSTNTDRHITLTPWIEWHPSVAAVPVPGAQVQRKLENLDQSKRPTQNIVKSSIPPPHTETRVPDRPQAGESRSSFHNTHLSFPAGTTHTSARSRKPRENRVSPDSAPVQTGASRWSKLFVASELPLNGSQEDTPK